jgi:hypothetical protein
MINEEKRQGGLAGGFLKSNSRNCEADKRKHPPGGLAIAAVGGILPIAMGADVDGKNVLCFDTDLQELETVSRAQVEEILVASAGDRSEQGVRKPGIKEGPADIPPDLVTGVPDAGTEGRQDG